MGSLSEEKNTTDQKYPSYIINRFFSNEMHLRRIQKQFNFLNSDIIAMEEKVAWNNMVSNTIVEVIGSKEVPMKSTGYDKVYVSVCLTGKANKSKWKPFIAFKGPKTESRFPNEEFNWKLSVATSTNR